MDKRNETFWIGVGASLVAIVLWDIYKARSKTFNYNAKNKK